MRAPRAAVVVGSVILGLAVLAVVVLGTAPGRPDGGTGPVAGGWFRLAPPASWDRLPDDRTCAGRVHRSSWEPRPSNRGPNHYVPDQQAVHRSFATRPRSGQGTYDPRWDSWLMPRVTGNHTGTTDENIQWAACKWGLPDDLLRSIAFNESNWYQALTRPDGSCVERQGCGDVVDRATRATRLFCRRMAAAGVDYQTWYGRGRCPRTFSIVGVMSWQDPRWGAMPGNQNGTFPFNHRSTAFALDFVGAFLRGCDEGWIRWLGDARGSTYAPGRIWGCVGVWYAGAWQSPEALAYAARVRVAEHTRPWLRRGFTEG